MRAGRGRRAVTLAAGLCALAWGGVPAARAQSTTVTVDGVPRQVSVLEAQGRRFVALRDVAAVLGGSIVASSGERAVLEVDGDRLTVRRRLPFVERGGRWYQMTDAAQRDASGFWVPASVLDHLLPVLWPGRFPRVEPGDRRAVPTPQRAPGEEAPSGGVESGVIGAREPAGPASDLERIDVWAGPHRTRLTLRLARTPDVSVERAGGGALELAVDGLRLPPSVAAGLAGVGLVDSASVASRDDGSVLTLWLDRRATAYSVAPLTRPVGLEIVLAAGSREEAVARLTGDAVVPRPMLRTVAAGPGAYGGGSEAPREPSPTAHAPAPEGSRSDAAASPTLPAVPAEDPPPARAGGWTVVLDAGHGGTDPGSIGPHGTREKDVTLAVALELRRRLAEVAPDVHVVLTRSDDTFVPLGERTRTANRVGADLFVSIHANSAPRPAAEGFETYFLSAARTEDARRVARMENAALRYEDPSIDPESLDDVNFILRDLAQNEYLRESSALAETVQEEMDRRLPLKSRGVKQAGFFVLNGAYMPAILFEMGFISNPQEEAKLDDSQFRSRLVDGLARSLVAYLGRYSRKVGPARAAR